LNTASPTRVTPLPFGSGEEYLKLLREAQRESNQSSRVVSLASSIRGSPRGSPKSPPNSPNTEELNEEELKGIYINYWNKVCTKQARI
jgi:BCL2/adenovirus E1B 19 kDa protein-interacting protein 3